MTCVACVRRGGVRGVNINQVKYFVTVFDLQSFSVAARQQGVTVQAVSKAIGDLEREVGRKLFERSSRGVVPTEEGVAFCQKARPVTQAYAELEDYIAGNRAQPDPHKGVKLELCAPNFAGNEGIRNAFTLLVGNKTGLDLDFSLEYPKKAVADLESGICDGLVTIGRYNRSDCNCKVIGTLTTGIEVLRDHPLAQKQFVTLPELSQYPANMSPELDSFNESVLVMYRNRKLLGKVEVISDQSEMETFMRVRKGYYFSAVLPIPRAADSKSVCVPIDPKDALKVPICIVSLKDRRTPQLCAVEDFLLQAMQRVSGLSKAAAGARSSK